MTYLHQLVICSRRAMASLNRDSNAEGAAEGAEALEREAPDVVGQRGLEETDEGIAVNARFVPEPLVDADVNLSGEAVPAAHDRRADDGGESGVDYRLAAHHDKNPRPLGVATPRMTHPVELAPSPHISPAFVARAARRCAQWGFRPEGRGGVLDSTPSTPRRENTAGCGASPAAAESC